MLQCAKLGDLLIHLVVVVVSGLATKLSVQGNGRLTLRLELWHMEIGLLTTNQCD